MRDRSNARENRILYTPRAKTGARGGCDLVGVGAKGAGLGEGME